MRGVEAALSHDTPQMRDHLGPFDAATFDASQQQAQVIDDVGGDLGCLDGLGRPPVGFDLAASVDVLLLGSALLGLVVGHAALRGISPLMMVAAAEWAEEIVPAGVAGRRQKADPAMPTHHERVGYPLDKAKGSPKPRQVTSRDLAV
jgi:hypothetical protein